MKQSDLNQLRANVQRAKENKLTGEGKVKAEIHTGKKRRPRLDSNAIQELHKQKMVNYQILSICDELSKKGFIYVTELKFHPLRKWRFDIALPSHKIAIEYNGGGFTQGRHTRPMGYAADLDKINAAQMLGWKVFQFTTTHFSKGGCGAYGVVELIKQTIGI